MATYTENYQLHQWVPEDNFLRTDFNQDFQRIDEALAAKAAQSALESVQELAEGKCRMIVGYYAGNNYNPRTINVGLRPPAPCPSTPPARPTAMWCWYKKGTPGPKPGGSCWLIKF